MVTLPLALCLSALTAPQDPPAGGRSLAILSLRPFTTMSSASTPIPYGTMITCRETEWQGLFGPGERDAQFQADHVGNWLAMLFSKPLEDGRMQTRIAGEDLLLVAPPDLGGEVEQQLRAVTGILGRPIEIDVAVLALPAGELPPTVLDAAAANALRGQPALIRATATTRSSRRIAIDQLRWSRFVRDVNVEVAQKSSIANPVLDAFAEGLGVLVDPHALVDSEDLVLFVRYALGQRRPGTRSMSTGIPDQPGVDLPQLETAFGTSSARVPSGGALVIPLGGDAAAGCRLLLTISARYPTPPAGGNARLAVLPVSALQTALFTAEVPPPGAHPSLFDEYLLPYPEHQENTEREHALAPEALAELLRASVGDGSARIELDGGHAFVSGDGAAVRAVTATLARLQERMLKNVEVRCTVELKEVDGAGPFAAELAGAAPSILHDVALCSLLGRTATLFRGLEANAIRTQVSEIAQEAAVVKPVVETLQSGIFVSTAPDSPGDGIAADLKVEQIHQSAPTPRPLAPAGMVMLSDTGVGRFSRQERMPAGKDVVLGTAPVITFEGRHWRPLVRAQARAR